MSKRKPMNDLAGYVASLKSHAGGRTKYLVILDRDHGGAWIDAEHRWVLLTSSGSHFCSYTNLRAARRDMKAAANDSGADVWTLLAEPEDEDQDAADYRRAAEEQETVLAEQAEELMNLHTDTPGEQQ